MSSSDSSRPPVIWPRFSTAWMPSKNAGARVGPITNEVAGNDRARREISTSRTRHAATFSDKGAAVAPRRMRSASRAIRPWCPCASIEETETRRPQPLHDDRKIRGTGWRQVATQMRLTARLFSLDPPFRCGELSEAEI